MRFTDVILCLFFFSFSFFFSFFGGGWGVFGLWNVN